MDDDAPARAKIMEHWRASERGDSAAEHAIYAAGAIRPFRLMRTIANRLGNSTDSGACPGSRWRGERRNAR